MIIEKFTITNLKKLNTLLCKYFSEYYINKNGVIIGLPLFGGSRIRMFIDPRKDIFNDIYVQPNKLRSFLANLKVKETKLEDEDDKFIFTTLDSDGKEVFTNLPRHKYSLLRLAKINKYESFIDDIFDNKSTFEYHTIDNDTISSIASKNFVRLPNGACISLDIIPDINKALCVEYANVPRKLIPQNESIDDSKFMMLKVVYEYASKSLIDIYIICKFVF